jgi:hypothetical protein
VVGDLGDGLGPLGAVVGFERFGGAQSVVAIFGVVDLRQRRFCARMRRLRKGGKNIRDGVEPASLLTVSGNT